MFPIHSSISSDMVRVSVVCRYFRPVYRHTHRTIGSLWVTAHTRKAGSCAIRRVFPRFEIRYKNPARVKSCTEQPHIYPCYFQTNPKTYGIFRNAFEDITQKSEHIIKQLNRIIRKKQPKATTHIFFHHRFTALLRRIAWGSLTPPKAAGNALAVQFKRTR